MPKSVFENVLNGFNIPLSVLNHWVEDSRKASTFGGDEYTSRHDPVAVWNTSENVDIETLFAKCKAFGERHDTWYGDVNDIFDRMWNNMDNVVNAIEAERHKKYGDIILFGRDCWPISLRMVQRGIKHYYVEGASRGLMHNMKFKDMFTAFVPKPEGSILVDTGYEGSVPVNFCRAYGMTSFANDTIKFDSDCRIQLIGSDAFVSRQLQWELRGSSEGCRRDYACFLECTPKFFGRPDVVSQDGFPEMRIAQQATSAAILYILMEKAAQNKKQKETQAA